MQDLQLVSAEPGGEHLVLVDAQGSRYRLPVDDSVRTAVRRAHAPARADTGHGAPTVAPREVQAVIRSGASPEEAAERTGWTVERVLLFAGPILAEREHIALRARANAVRLRGRGGEAPTLEARVVERLTERGVDPATATWDASRPTGGQEWQVRLSFVAGGRERHATWTYDLGDQILHAGDDEARWLSEDETEAAAPGAAASATYLSAGVEDDAPARGPRRRGAAPQRPDTDTDSEAAEPEAAGEVPTAEPEASEPTRAERPDLVSAMRERSKARGRRGRRRSTAEAQTPPPEPVVNDELPFDGGVPHRAADPVEQAGAVGTESAPVPEATEDDLPFGWRELTADTPDADLPEDEPLADDLLGDLEEPAEFEDVAETEQSDAGVSGEAGNPGGSESPVLDAETDPEPLAEDPGHTGDIEDIEDIDNTGDNDDSDEPAADRAEVEAAEAPKKRKGRPSVPSWDDIMFGGRA